MYVYVISSKQVLTLMAKQITVLKGLDAMQSAGYISILIEVVSSFRMLGAYLPDYMVSHSKRQHSSEQYTVEYQYNEILGTSKINLL